MRGVVLGLAGVGWCVFVILCYCRWDISFVCMLLFNLLGAYCIRFIGGFVWGFLCLVFLGVFGVF